MQTIGQELIVLREMIKTDLDRDRAHFRLTHTGSPGPVTVMGAFLSGGRAKKQDSG